MARLSNRVCLVTGAAGGIGSATCLRLADEGARIFMVDRDANSLRALSDDIEKLGNEVHYCCEDLTARGAANRIINNCATAFGALDVLFNNAGIGGGRPVHESDDEHLAMMLNIHVMAVFDLSKEALQLLSQSPHARIINMASVLGLIGLEGTSTYAAAKAAIIGLTRAMAADYGRRSINVNCVAPGHILTPMSQRNLDTKPWYKEVAFDTVPIRKWGTPADIAAAVAFFASDDAKFISGQTLAIDGGLTATKLSTAVAAGQQ